MTGDPLDRPVWSALTGPQARLALGDSRAVRIAPALGYFAAAADASRDSLAALGALVRAHGETWLVEAVPPPAPSGVKAVRRALCHQMVRVAVPAAPPPIAIRPLDEGDAPAMRALALLTRPGPFLGGTHRFGGFVGIEQDGRLVAMAGERLRPPGFAEVSGVCTHPDHRGRGYAGALIRVVADRIAARGETPILHVYPDNQGAIALYEALGFAFARTVHLAVLMPDG